MMRSARARAGRPACILGVCLLVMIEAADATEITVQNDSFQSGGTVAVESGFVTNESAAAWLTSPCNGNIVAVQVFWSSIFGGSPQVLGDSITIFNTGTFPVPNAANFTLLEGPVLTDGVLNEFRYLDENQTIPISIPVVSGQVFIVSFRFGEDPDPFNGPSVVADINGCQQGKNSANIVGSGWVNACNLGISGDFVIRAVINCADAQGACCLTSGGCQITSQSACSSQGGSYRGNNTTCQTNTCDGACCFADGTCTQTNQGNCTSGGGTYKGVGVACTAGLCVGACCLPNGSCSDAQSRTLCSAAGGDVRRIALHRRVLRAERLVPATDADAVHRPRRHLERAGHKLRHLHVSSGRGMLPVGWLVRERSDAGAVRGAGRKLGRRGHGLRRGGHLRTGLLLRQRVRQSDEVGLHRFGGHVAGRSLSLQWLVVSDRGVLFDPRRLRGGHDAGVVRSHGRHVQERHDLRAGGLPGADRGLLRVCHRRVHRQPHAATVRHHRRDVGGCEYGLPGGVLPGAGRDRGGHQQRRGSEREGRAAVYQRDAGHADDAGALPWGLRPERQPRRGRYCGVCERAAEWAVGRRGVNAGPRGRGIEGPRDRGSPRFVDKRF